jgi:hypothetical protein
VFNGCRYFKNKEEESGEAVYEKMEHFLKNLDIREIWMR